MGVMAMDRSELNKIMGEFRKPAHAKFFASVRDCIKRSTRCTTDEAYRRAVPYTRDWIAKGCREWSHASVARLVAQELGSDGVIAANAPNQNALVDDESRVPDVAGDDPVFSGGGVSGVVAEVDAGAGEADSPEPAVALKDSPRKSASEASAASRPVRDEEAAWERLKRAAKDRKASKVAVQEWAADHLRTRPDQIDAKEVPSRGAIDFLRWARSNQAEFHKTFYAKGTAAKQAPVVNGRMSDDGRSITDIITSFGEFFRRRAVLSSGPEGAG